MVSFKSFCTNITTYIKEKRNYKLREYINNHQDYVNTYNESEYRIKYFNCFLRKCIECVNIQGFFILISSGFTLEVDKRQYCIIGTSFKNGDFDTCFFLRGLGFTTGESFVDILNIMESDKIITVDDIDVISRIYSMTSIMKSLSCYTVGYTFVHTRAMHILDSMPSNHEYKVENVYLKPDNQPFVITLLENGYIDPTEMWTSTIQFSLGTSFEWGVYMYHEEDSIMESLCCQTLEFAIRYGADTSRCLMHNKNIQVRDLKKYILNTPNRIRRYRRRYNDRTEFMNFVKSIDRVNRVYKRILEMSIYTQRCKYIGKKIRGFNVEDEPSILDRKFICLPSEIFSQIVSFIV